ncbi:MAG: Ig-like domain-containing protein [Planctomycetes bacterium]|nr:Ig-like domain-containing protein [Planctomycetota bacterium]
MAASALALVAGGCFDHRPSSSSQASNPTGSLIDHPDFDPLHPERGSRRLIVEENEAGQTSQLKIVSSFWGRIVKVRDQLGNLQQSNMVVGEDIVSDGIDYLVETNAITLETTVTILHPYTPSTVIGGVETSAYQRAFDRLDRNLAPVNDKSLDPSELPPFSLVPRNSAIVLKFNDLLDKTLIDRTTVQLFSGYPPEAPLETLVFADPNHGDAIDTDGDGTLEFYPTRIIIDPTITPREASEFAVSPNATGFPASLTTNLANLAVRVPTRTEPSEGQNEVLRNLSGHPVAFLGNGSNDTSSSTRDVVRAARSGGKTEITGDTSNGFLSDTTAPRVVGTQPVVIGTPTGGPTVFASSITFLNSTCAMATKVGDVLQQANVFGEITEVAVPVGSQIASVQYRIVEPSTTFFSAGQGTLSTVWDPATNVNKQACFVRFPSISQPPAAGVATDSPVIVRFSEPMDPVSVNAFETLTVTNFDPATVPTSPERGYTVGRVTPSSDSQEFRLEPSLPLRHTSGLTESYWVNVPNSDLGPLDLAGNKIAAALPPVLFTIDATEATVLSGNLVLRFTSVDEIPVTGTTASPGPEVRGQIQVNFLKGELEPRQVVRTAIPVDRTQPTLNAMTPTAGGTQTPLSQLGSKMMTVWRYVDTGFVITDDRTMNMDVEGLAWSPLGGNVVADVFDAFQISLSHSSRLPDEGQFIDAMMNVFTYPASGLLGTYDQNYLNTATDPPKVVHTRDRGYTVSPSDRFIATSGSVMLPYPLNRGVAPEEKEFYTWRDTSILSRGGLDSAGVEMAITFNLGLPHPFNLPLPNPPPVGTLWGQNGPPITQPLVPTIGLPLLMEFRCYPDNSALGLNVFDVSNVTLFGQPRTRAFSQGGVATGGVIVVKDPDLQNVATGGFNPASAPPGLATAGVDTVFYVGQLNLVTRVSRAHTIWFDTPTVNVPRYVTPIVDPAPERQPTGTSIVLAFRGASNITAGNNSLLTAASLDAYGDIATGVTFHSSSTGGNWRSDMSEIDGAEFFQTRISFISNAQTNLSPTLSALGFAFRQ